MFTQRFSPPVAAAVAACVMAATAVFADTDEAALYAPELPSDAIFLRWVDTDVPLPALGLPHQPVAGQEAYRPLSARHLSGAEPGAFYSVLAGPEGTARLVEEPARGQKSKVHLILLNASGQPVRLVLADAGHEVIQQTNAFASGGRMVNPVSARLAVLADDDSPLGEVAVRLRRGQNVTVLVTDEGVRLIENQIGDLLEE